MFPVFAPSVGVITIVAPEISAGLTVLFEPGRRFSAYVSQNQRQINWGHGARPKENSIGAQRFCSPGATCDCNDVGYSDNFGKSASRPNHATIPKAYFYLALTSFFWVIAKARE
jgi:hypothetical protein